MLVNKVDLNVLNNSNKLPVLNRDNSQTNREFQTSLYNTKGLQVYFKGLVRGVSVAEDLCISLLRNAKNGPYRRFSEDDIQNIITSLKKVEDSGSKIDITYEVLELDESRLDKLPDPKFINKLIKLLADKPQDDHFAILEFAQNDLQKSVKPMEAFFNLPEKKQDDLLVFLRKIDELNDNKFYKSNKAREAAVDSLYDTFKILLYGHEDFNKIHSQTALKTENLEILNADKDYYKNLKNTYRDNKSKDKVISLVNEMTDYFKTNF